MNRLQRSFLIEKGLTGADLKKELTLGGRVNVKDLDGGSWMNPSVVLRRLTVTIGGFKIELLPGPSYAEAMDVAQSAYLDSVTCGPDVGFNVLPDDNVTIQKVAAAAVVAESKAEVDAKDSCSAEDPALAPGPYVNPNDVQSANGTETESPGVQETKPNGDSGPHRAKEGKQAQSDEKHVSTKTELKSLKSPLKSAKSKDLVASEPNHGVKRQKETHDVPSAAIQREDVHKTKVLKEKKDVSTLKRPAENAHGDPATKVPKVQKSADDKAKPKLPSSPGPLTKKTHSLGSRAEQQSPAKHLQPHSAAKAESAHATHATHNRPVQAARAPDEGGQEKSKVKKPEKILQKQKSKSSRSISVEEPQLFVPDNAPVTKKESSEEQPANSETVWDGNNCCGLCKKHHNNM